MSAAPLLGVSTLALAIVCFILWRDGRANSKEAANTYIALLKEQFSDANRRKDLFDDLTTVVREQRQELSGVRQELTSMRADIQRLRP